MATAGNSFIEPFYFVSVSIAIGLALFFPVTKHLRSPAERRQYYILQAITILGAVAGAKLSALMGDHHWPFQPVENWKSILLSGRSITGALIGGFLAAEIGKPLLNYNLPPNDRFAAILPFSIGLGRIGCSLTGCCLGAPHHGVLSIAYSDGIPRYPAQLYEAAFHFACGIAFLVAVKNKFLFGRLFAFYLIIYGLFRFLTENIRATPKDWAGYSAYQWLSIFMAALGLAFLLKRTISPPSHWQSYKTFQQPAT